MNKLKFSYLRNIRHFPKLGLMTLLLFGSCKKFVTVELPNTRIGAPSVYNNSASATTALISIYSQMMNQYQSSPYMFPCLIPTFTGLSGDELTNYATLSDQIQFFTNSINPISNGVISSNLWTPAYSYIYQANAIITGLESSVSVNEKVKLQLIGEAKFIRAFHYFYLVNLFGDVPLTTTTDYSVNSSLPRADKGKVYQQIVNDLTDAANKLSENYVDLTDTAITTDRVRPNKSAAIALLSRVYLYIKDWKNAEIQSSTVLENSSKYNLISLSQVFLANSEEAIWQLMPDPNTGYDTPEGFEFILNNVPDVGGNNSNALSNHLLNAFEAGDKRRQIWVDSIIVGTNIYYFPSKYKIYTSAATEYSMVLRLAEQYLIRAEAKAQQNDIPGSIADLNAVRTRAGLALYSGSATQAPLLSAILHERQVELFTEWGHRWLDLKRTLAIDAVMGMPGDVCKAKGGSWNINSQLYPIPLNEIQNDPKIIQNPGY